VLFSSPLRLISFEIPFRYPSRFATKVCEYIRWHVSAWTDNRDLVGLARHETPLVWLSACLLNRQSPGSLFRVASYTRRIIMKNTVLAIVFAVGAFAQTPNTSATEKTQENSTTQVNPDGTAVQSSDKTHAKSNTTSNPDGTAVHSAGASHQTNTTVTNPDGTQSSTQVKRARKTTTANTPGGTSTSEHSSSESTSTTSK
jgi:hypothetical protein